MVGYSFAFTADFNKAMVAAARVFQLLDRKPLIDTNPSVGLKLNQVDGNVKLRDAEFTYPTRQNIQILNRLNLSLKAGESIALVQAPFLSSVLASETIAIYINYI